jgi:predicted XRE-type DNA-binding protein
MEYTRQKEFKENKAPTRLNRRAHCATIPVRGGMETKVMLCGAIGKIVLERQLTQPETARLLGINQPKVSALLNQKLSGFSVERLMHFLVSLQQDVVIQVTPHSRKPVHARGLITSQDRENSSESAETQILAQSISLTKLEIVSILKADSSSCV